MKKVIILVTCISLISARLFSQVDGTLDSTFNFTGKFTKDCGFTDLFNDVKIQSDQKIVSCGVSYDVNYGGKLKVFRNMPDGSYDPSFGTYGIYSLTLNYESSAYECYIKSDGKIIVAGITYMPSTGYAMLLLQLNSNGTLDQSFGTNGITVADFTTYDDLAQCMTIQHDGKILLAGYITDSIMRNIPTIARFTANGMVDNTFGINGIAQMPIVEADNEFTSVIEQPDGKIIASGHYAPTMWVHTLLLIRFNSNGTLDPNFGSGGIDTLNISNAEDESFGMQLKTDGHILLSGFTTAPGYNLNGLLVQYNSNGTLDASFGTNGITTLHHMIYDVFSDVKIQPDNKILCAGASGTGTGDRDFFLARFKSNGILDSSFGINGYVLTQFFGSRDDANAIALQADGKIVLAGKADSGTQVLNFAIARYTNAIDNSSSAIQEHVSNINISAWPNPISATGSLTLNFELQNTADVTLEIYDVLGNRSATIVMGILPSGRIQKEIQLPETLGSGIYFLKINCNGTTSSTLKLIISNQ